MKKFVAFLVIPCILALVGSIVTIIWTDYETPARILSDKIMLTSIVLLFASTVFSICMD
jgi:hypothetical protein